MSSKRRWGVMVMRLIAALVAIAALYLIAVYSNIPFINKWRTIYIETAMSTMTHQWLATAFIPESVVSKVTDDMLKQQEENMVDTNNIEKPTHATMWLGHPMGLSDEQIAERDFIDNYAEIDLNTMPVDIKYNQLVMYNCENIKTIHGDTVYAIDTVNGFVIVNIQGDGYVGKLVIVKDPSQVKIASSNRKYAGDFVVNIVEQSDAILGINASGFVDPEGHGNGGQAVGLVKSNNELLNEKTEYGYWFVVGFDNDDNLMIGSKVDYSLLRDAVQFKPALIIDGEKRVEGSSGWGIQPRSAIGQTADKQVLLLTIDGRKPGYSIGATVGECANIMERYGAINAINLDGGSSTALAYNNKTINVPCTSSGNKDGRYVPNAWVVTRKND